MIQPAALSDMPNEGCRTALQFWLEAKGARTLPNARAIDPIRLPRSLLPNFSVISVEPGPKRLKFRLVGTGVVNALGLDPTGKFGEDLEGASSVNARFLATIKTKNAYFYGGRLDWSPMDFKTYRALVMPFGDEQGEVVRFLSYTEFE